MLLGYAATVTLIALALLLSAAPLARRGPWGILSWLLSALVNESPSLGLAYLLLSTLPAFTNGEWREPGVRLWFAVGCAGFVVTPLLLRRAAQARRVLQHALADGLGPN